MKVIIGCERSGVVRRAFRARGHDAWSCDLEPADDGSEFHYRDDIRAVLNFGPKRWDLGIFHPPCDFLTGSANRWLFEECSRGTPEQRRKDREEAIEFFLFLYNCRIPKVGVENPQPHPYVIERVGPYQQKIQPWEFGDKATKGTCLWLRNLPPLMATIIEVGKDRRPLCHREAPGPNRKANRSRTYPGIAEAMAKQWGMQ